MFLHFQNLLSSSPSTPVIGPLLHHVMFSPVLILVFTALVGVSQGSRLLVGGAQVPPPCGDPAGPSLRSCRLCEDLLGEFDAGECCSDVAVGSLCQTFLDSISASSKRSFFGKRFPLDRASALFKKNRNTFLGKRFSPTGDLDEEINLDGMMTSSAEKRQRNNFLGKRVARSVVSRDGGRVGDSGGRVARLIRAFVSELAAELMVEVREREGSRAAASLAGAESERTEHEKAEQEKKAERDGVEKSESTGKLMELDREQRAKNTFLGKRSA